ncbi:hypothetical protein Ddc_21542 [Ditylenchus destructor]|nr:hypothetical protein Ddc_21542 [Ditylenchus destructor]
MRRDGREKREWRESTVLSGVRKWKRKRDTLESTGKVGKSPADTMGREDIKVQWRQPNPCRFARYRKLRAEFWCVKSSAAVALENKCRGTTIEVR